MLKLWFTSDQSLEDGVQEEITLGSQNNPDICTSLFVNQAPEPHITQGGSKYEYSPNL